MTVPCVTPAGSSPYLVYDGNVQSVPIMTCAQFVTMATNTTCDTDFFALRHQGLKSELIWSNYE